MKKTLLLILILCLITAVGLAAFTACRPEPQPPAEVTLTGLEVKSYPKQYYKQHEAIDLTGGKLLAAYSDGSTQEIDFTDSRVTVKDYGTKVLEYLYEMKATYMDKTVTLKYYVSATVTGITFNPKTMQLKYSVNSKINYKDAQFTIKKAVGSSAATAVNASSNATLFELSGFETSATGEKIMKIRYYASVFEIDYTVVKDKFVVSSSLNSNDIIVIYLMGEELDLGGALLTVSYSDSTAVQTAVTAAMVTGFSTQEAKPDGAEMTITYKGAGGPDDYVLTETVTYYVYSESAVTGIAVAVAAGEVNFNVGESLKFNKTLLEVTLSGSNVKAVSLSNARVTITGFDSSTRTATARYMTISYKVDESTVLETQLQYYVTPTVLRMELIDGDTIKLSYVEGEPFDFGEAQIRVVFDDGIDEYYYLQQQFELPLDDKDNPRKISIYTLIATSGTSNYIRLTPSNIDMSAGTHRILAGWNTLDTEYTVTSAE